MPPNTFGHSPVPDELVHEREIASCELCRMREQARLSTPGVAQPGHAAIVMIGMPDQDTPAPRR